MLGYIYTRSRFKLSFRLRINFKFRFRSTSRSSVSHIPAFGLGLDLPLEFHQSHVEDSFRVIFSFGTSTSTRAIAQCRFQSSASPKLVFWLW